jgi:hypothetical protein
VQWRSYLKTDPVTANCWYQKETREAVGETRQTWSIIIMCQKLSVITGYKHSRRFETSCVQWKSKKSWYILVMFHPSHHCQKLYGTSNLYSTRVYLRHVIQELGKFNLDSCWQTEYLNLFLKHEEGFFPMAQQPLVGQGLLIMEASRSHSDTPQSVGLLWTSDRPNAETSTWQHKTLKRHRYPCLWRNSNLHS